MLRVVRMARPCCGCGVAQLSVEATVDGCIVVREPLVDTSSGDSYHMP